MLADKNVLQRVYGQLSQYVLVTDESVLSSDNNLFYVRVNCDTADASILVYIYPGIAKVMYYSKSSQGVPTVFLIRKPDGQSDIELTLLNQVILKNRDIIRAIESGEAVGDLRQYGLVGVTLAACKHDLDRLEPWPKILEEWERMNEWWKPEKAAKLHLLLEKSKPDRQTEGK